MVAKNFSCIDQWFLNGVCIPFSSDVVTRVNDSTRLESRFLVTLTRLESRSAVSCDDSWLESRFSSNDSTRLILNDSWLESESFLENLQTLADKLFWFAHKEMSRFWFTEAWLVVFEACFPLWLCLLVAKYQFVQDQVCRLPVRNLRAQILHYILE